MQVIKLAYPIKEKLTPGKVVLALGFFDGVHRGHQVLIRKAKTIAEEKGLQLMVMTFDLHPKVIFHGQRDFRYIDSPAEKARKMEALGVDYLVFAQFRSGFADMRPREFIDQVIVKLQPDTVVAGFDYTYGRADIANMQTLPIHARNRFAVVEVPEQKFAGRKIGSTEIREAIKKGDMDLAAELLGQPYVLCGKVVQGKKLGRKMGFPTLNLELDFPNIIPKIGVYATRTKVFGKWYYSMTSVGYNVTFNQKEKIYIESNLFDFDEVAYGQEIAIEFDNYMRGELDFANAKELSKQMSKDQVAVQRFFKKIR